MSIISKITNRVPADKRGLENRGESLNRKKGKEKKFSLERRRARLGIILLLPSLLIILFIVLYPLITSFVWAFMKKSLGARSEAEFIGLKNFLYLFRQPVFWKSLCNSTILTVCNVLFQTVLGMVIALLLNMKFRLRAMVRGLFILPWATPTFVAAFAWSWMVDAENGMVNIILKELHILSEGIPWLNQPGTALIVVIIAHIWKDLPWMIMIFLSGLQMVPEQLQEAARVDGASRWQEFWNVTVPSMKSIIIIAILLRIIWTFKFFDFVQLLTGGGPLDSTMTIPIMIYQQGFESYSMGRASALGVILFIVLGIFSLFYFKALSKDGEM